MADAQKIWNAIETENPHELKLAITSSSDADTAASDGDRPLHKCCESGFNAGIDILISKGADPASLGKEQFTPLMVCAIEDNIEGLKRIQSLAPQTISSQVFRELLILAASHNSVEVAKFVLENGIDPDSQDPNSDGRAPLHWAAQQGSADVASQLLSAGANPNITDIDGFTPLHVAAAENQHIILRLLTQAGGDFSMKCDGDDSATPLHIACTWENIDTVRELIGLNADRRALNAAGQSPIDIAMQTGNADLIALIES